MRYRVFYFSFIRDATEYCRQVTADVINTRYLPCVKEHCLLAVVHLQDNDALVRPRLRRLTASLAMGGVNTVTETGAKL
jgi:hypothetical protein